MSPRVNRRPTRYETSYYNLVPSSAELRWQVHLHRADREYQRDIKHRQFTWTEADGSLHDLELNLYDGEIRSFSGSPLPAALADMTPALWATYLHARHPARELAAARADGWTAEIWIPAPEPLTLF